MLPDGGKFKRVKRTFDKLENFQLPLFRILKKAKPEMGISKEAMGILNSILLDVYRKVARSAAEFSKFGSKQTLDALDVQSATKLLIPGELGSCAVQDAT